MFITRIVFSCSYISLISIMIFQPCTAQNKSGMDSVATGRAIHIAELKKYIQSKESLPADSVFKNLQTIGGFEAGLMPVIMEKWSIALGVGCEYCHDTNNWASDTVHEKKTARQMAGPLNEAIRTVLGKIEGLSERPVVNCATCHRGEIKPATRVK